MAVSLNLPMILAKSRKEGKDFYEVLDHYLNMIRNIHCRTYDYLGEMRASCNPLGYCMGGFLGGHLNYTDKIKPLLKPMTASFGVTALNELQQLYNKKSLVEDGEFALEVMKYINDKVNEFKKEDGHLYALYGVPAENLCFSGNTLIQTYRGNVAIKDIVPGDLVYSFNEEKHKVELKKVVASQMTNSHAVVVRIKFDNGQEEICTPNHPIAVRMQNFDEKGLFTGESINYIPAGELKAGMRIKSNYYNGRHQMIHIVNTDHKVVTIEYMDDLIPVYNIEVEDNHNYFVGGNNGILVHNCGLQVKQFRKIYGIIENVSDRDYVSNSFHCHVTEDITPTQKQDLEYRFWNYFNGGKIQYVRYHLRYNKDAIRTLIRRAMKMGFYEGVNLSMCYCNDCGEEFLDGDECPKCHSTELTKIDRMNGYLAYSRVHGYTRLNNAKMAEIKDRKSM